MGRQCGAAGMAAWQAGPAPGQISAGCGEGEDLGPCNAGGNRGRAVLAGHPPPVFQWALPWKAGAQSVPCNGRVKWAGSNRFSVQSGPGGQPGPKPARQQIDDGRGGDDKISWPAWLVPVGVCGVWSALPSFCPQSGLSCPPALFPGEQERALRACVCAAGRSSRPIITARGVGRLQQRAAAARLCPAATDRRGQRNWGQRFWASTSGPT